MQFLGELHCFILILSPYDYKITPTLINFHNPCLLELCMFSFPKISLIVAYLSPSHLLAKRFSVIKLNKLSLKIEAIFWHGSVEYVMCWFVRMQLQFCPLQIQQSKEWFLLWEICYITVSPFEEFTAFLQIYLKLTQTFFGVG